MPVSGTGRPPGVVEVCDDRVWLSARAENRVHHHELQRGLDMAVVLAMHWAGVTPEQYDTVRDAVGWEEISPAGGQVHVAWFDEQGLHVTDVWESQQAFETFFAEHLAPAIQKAGIAGTPETGFSPLHRRFIAPGTNGAA